MMRQVLLLPLLCAAACSFPRFVASKVVEYSMPASSVTQLLCESHNGDITVIGDATSTQVEVRAELSVRGHTQGDADANLHLLEVGREETNGSLRLFGKYPSSGLHNCSPSFTFTLKVPQSLVVRLESHNGDLSLRGTVGKVNLETHNGSIDANVESIDIATTTHNGDVRLFVTGEGPLNGQIESHNGDIELDLADGLGTTLEASTHNGRITPPSKVEDATVKKRYLKCRLGDGKGSLKTSTHNGSITVR